MIIIAIIIKSNINVITLFWFEELTSIVNSCIIYYYNNNSNYYYCDVIISNDNIDIIVGQFNY